MQGLGYFPLCMLQVYTLLRGYGHIITLKLEAFQPTDFHKAAPYKLECFSLILVLF